jgi:hypothetical protein
MTPSEISRLIYLLGGILLGLALIVAVLTVIRRRLEKRVRELVAQNRDSLVGKRALVVSAIRPSKMGNIRPLGTPVEETDRAADPQKDECIHDIVYPAISDEIISKGCVVRVTGGDSNRYIVRAL